jgi:hypothetical protein
VFAVQLGRDLFEFEELSKEMNELGRFDEDRAHGAALGQQQV